MLNYKLIFKVIGSLLSMETMMMMLCVAVALYYQENDIMPFVWSALITLGSSAFFLWLGHKAENQMSRRDAYLVVTLSWVVFSVFGSLPFYIGQYFDTYTNSFFETMSGFTTTGATVFDDVEHLPHGILFWRSLTQWIGGLGIVFFTIAVLPSLVGGSMKVFSAEATGPVKSKLHPRIGTTAKWIWSIYLFLTIACCVCFLFLDMGVFDAVNHAMTITATGGFGTHNDSIAFFNDVRIEAVSIFFQFIAGINFMMFYLAVFKQDFKNFFRNSELRFYCMLVISASAFIAYMLMKYNHYDLEHALRSSVFQVISFITTTGLFNDDAGQWPHVTWVVLGILMFTGACAGSTSGGFKSIRMLMIIKVTRNEFKHILHPKAVLPVKINGQNYTPTYQSTLLAFLSLYLLVCLFADMVMIFVGVDHVNAITISLSCVSNVGPTLGTQIGPEMSWNSLPDMAKWICTLLMLIGRLEIFSVLILFTREFWKDK